MDRATRWIVILTLAFAAACAGSHERRDDGTGDVDAGGDSSGGADAGSDVDGGESDAFHLVRLEPSTIPYRGGTTSLVYAGTPPESPPDFVEVNGQTGLATVQCGDPFGACPASSWPIFINAEGVAPPASTPAEPFDLTLYFRENGGLVPYTFAHAGSYAPPLPPSPRAFDTDLEPPLAPELARACARSGILEVNNDGDVPMRVTSATIAGDDAFTADLSTCSGELFYRHDCGIKLCFGSDVPGDHSATITLGTTAGEVEATLTAHVEPRSTGLDPALGGSGAVPVDYVYETAGKQGAFALFGDGVAVTSDLATPGLGVVRIAPDGTISTVMNAAQTQTDAIASAPDHRAIYVQTSVICAGLCPPSGLERFTDAGQDLAFGGDGVADVIANDVAVAPSGTILVRGGGQISALDPSGAPLATFGDGGVIDVSAGDSDQPFGIAIDPENRLYVANTLTGILRVSTVDGSVDPTFSYAGDGLLAIDPQGRLVVASGTSVVRVDETGLPTDLALETPAGFTANIQGLAFDGDGRLLLARGDDGVLRYLPDGTFDAQLGLPGAAGVVCPAAGGCWAFGVTGQNHDWYVERLAE